MILNTHYETRGATESTKLHNLMDAMSQTFRLYDSLYIIKRRVGH